MMRYAVWMLPLFAWLIAECGLPARRLVRWAGMGITVQAVILLGLGRVQSYVHQTPLAQFVLTRAPELYDPEPEIFIERQLHREDQYNPAWLPLPFVTNNGRVTKILLDRESLERLPSKFVVDTGYWNVVRQAYQNRPGLFYLNPPRDMVKLEPIPPLEQFKSKLTLSLEGVPQTLSTPQLQANLRILNASDWCFWPLASGKYTPLRLVYQELNESGQYLSGGYWDLPDTLHPGQTQTIPVRVTLPQRTGEYRMEVRPLLDNVAWGDLQIRLHVSVHADGNYHVQVREECKEARP
jgi:hypothetical protein